MFETGSSPRVRSGQQTRPSNHLHGGIISACAERTSCKSAVSAVEWDHLRVCGADVLSITACRPISGSSPRVRSGLGRTAPGSCRRGIISACAERTGSGANARLPPRDHLRVCGADRCCLRIRGWPSGSSPRVRSGRGTAAGWASWPGIISACAERTGRFFWQRHNVADHLRVCGADGFYRGTARVGQGSSPRVRSGQQTRPSNHLHGGIISACAERTSAAKPESSPYRDHLRVCGADLELSPYMPATGGSSPRVRSGLSGQEPRTRRQRIISACAERTVRSPGRDPGRRDHLRVCGADIRSGRGMPAG